jgi:hypothetical protein
MHSLYSIKWKDDHTITEKEAEIEKKQILNQNSSCGIKECQKSKVWKS